MILSRHFQWYIFIFIDLLNYIQTIPDMHNRISSVLTVIAFILNIYHPPPRDAVLLCSEL